MLCDLKGNTLGQFQIAELNQTIGAVLANKGFKAVMNRIILIKVLRPQDPLTVQAFTQQNELRAQIRYHNVQPIYDSGQTIGRVCHALLPEDIALAKVREITARLLNIQKNPSRRLPPKMERPINR